MFESRVRFSLSAPKQKKEKCVKKFLVATLVAAAIAYAAVINVKVSDPVYINLGLQKSAEDVYFVDSKLIWPTEFYKLSAITKAYNISTSAIEAQDGYEGVNVKWVNVKGIKEGNFASIGLTALKPSASVVLPEPTTKVYDSKGVELASNVDADTEVAIAARDAVVITFQASTTVADGLNNNNDTVASRQKKVLTKPQ